VNIASNMRPRQGHSLPAAYCASKGGVVLLTQVNGAEYGQRSAHTMRAGRDWSIPTAESFSPPTRLMLPACRGASGSRTPVQTSRLDGSPCRLEDGRFDGQRSLGRRGREIPPDALRAGPPASPVPPIQAARTGQVPHVQNPRPPPTQDLVPAEVGYGRPIKYSATQGKSSLRMSTFEVGERWERSTRAPDTIPETGKLRGSARFRPRLSRRRGSCMTGYLRKECLARARRKRAAAMTRADGAEGVSTRLDHDSCIDAGRPRHRATRRLVLSTPEAVRRAGRRWCGTTTAATWLTMGGPIVPSP